MQTQKVVEIITLPKDSKFRCNDTRCDGRPARWFFPITKKYSQNMKNEIVVEHVRACNNHLAAMAKLVTDWHVEATPVPGTQCADFGTETDKSRPQCGSVAPVDKTVRCERYQGHHDMHSTASGMQWGSEDAT